VNIIKLYIYRPCIFPLTSPPPLSMFSSNKISQHNINSNIPYRSYTTHTIHTIQTQHCSCMDSTVSAYRAKTDHICHAQYIVHCSHPQHILTHSPCTSTCTPSTTHHTAYHNPLLTTKKHESIFHGVSGGKMAQDVGMV